MRDIEFEDSKWQSQIIIKVEPITTLFLPEIYSVDHGVRLVATIPYWFILTKVKRGVVPDRIVDLK